jgi:hypothetical protein
VTKCRRAFGRTTLNQRRTLRVRPARLARVRHLIVKMLCEALRSSKA